MNAGHPRLYPSMSQPTPVSSGRAEDPVRALVGEFLEEKQRERTRDDARRLKRGRSPIVTVVAAIVCAMVWILPSLNPPELWAPSPERVDASARMQVFLAAQRVFAYQRQTGRLPADLSQAGVDSNGLTYWRSTDSLFELRTIAGGVPLAYRSTMSQAEFLGNTFQVLGGGR
jgi:hypothetical protein